MIGRRRLADIFAAFSCRYLLPPLCITIFSSLRDRFSEFFISPVYFHYF